MSVHGWKMWRNSQDSRASMCVLWSVLLALAFIPVRGWASEARIAGMGSGVKRITVHDETGIWSLPTTLLDFDSWATLQGAGRLDDPFWGQGNVGVHVSLADTMVLAAYAGSHRRPTLSIESRFEHIGFGYTPLFSGAQASTDNDDGGPAIAGPGYTHHTALFFAMALSDSLRLGARVGVWLDGDDSGALVDDPLVLDAGLGCSTDVAGGNVAVGIGVKSGMGRRVGDVSFSKELALDVTVRGQWNTEKGHQVIPYLHSVHTSLMDDEHPAGTQRAAVLMVSAGVDLRWSLGDSVTIQPGVGVTYAREVVRWETDGRDVNTDLVAPYYNIAVDVRVTDWLNVRFGGSQEFQFIKADQGEGVLTTSSDVVHRVTTGLGWTLPGGVVFDMQLATDWGRRGPDIITGDRSTSLEGSGTLSMGW